MTATAVDFIVVDHGSIVVLRGVSPEASAWIEENVVMDDETQYWAGGVAVEQRYIVPIIEGLVRAGFRW